MIIKHANLTDYCIRVRFTSWGLLKLDYFVEQENKQSQKSIYISKTYKSLTNCGTGKRFTPRDLSKLEYFVAKESSHKYVPH